MTFPLRPIVEVSKAELAAKESGADSSNQDFRILVVDDNDLNRRVLRLILMKSGTPAAEAASGQEALDALQSEEFDLIFMDVQMPEMDGLEATKRIRADFPDEKQPFIIALTAHALPSDRQLCLEAGMDEYLSKPVEAARLLRWIERLRRLPRRLRTGLSATRRELDPSEQE
jgi:CheY-like chemotaxis protein